MPRLCEYEVMGGKCNRLATYLAVEPRDILAFESNKLLGEGGSNGAWLCAGHIDIFVQQHPTYDVWDDNPYECGLCAKSLTPETAEITSNGYDFVTRCKDRVACMARAMESGLDMKTWLYLTDTYDDVEPDDE